MLKTIIFLCFNDLEILGGALEVFGNASGDLWGSFGE